MIKTAILTISDTRKPANDKSGEALKELLPKEKYELCAYDIVKDERKLIQKKLVGYADTLKVDLVLTTGGTGIGPRDVTPEATRKIIKKEVNGLAELIRSEGYKKARTAVLSRGVAGVRGQTLIVNLPGSPKGAKESLEIVLEILEHALEMLKGGGH